MAYHLGFAIHLGFRLWSIYAIMGNGDFRVSTILRQWIRKRSH